MISELLNNNEYHPYYKNYINTAADKDVLIGLTTNLDAVRAFYENIPQDKHNYAYAEGKWTIKEILMHLIDTERIFAYRALRIARKDKTPMSGFEQDDYIAESDVAERSLASIIAEFEAVRKATIILYENFNDGALRAVGEASGSMVSVRAIGYIITGHENHHNRIITERYL